jgi:hypothetical protein
VLGESYGQPVHRLRYANQNGVVSEETMRGKLLRIRSLPLVCRWAAFIQSAASCAANKREGYNRAMDAATCFAALGAVFALVPICCQAIPERCSDPVERWIDRPVSPLDRTCCPETLEHQHRCLVLWWFPREPPVFQSL